MGGTFLQERRAFYLAEAELFCPTKKQAFFSPAPHRIALLEKTAAERGRLRGSGERRPFDAEFTFRSSFAAPSRLTSAYRRCILR
jgi:hypothetical protein